MWNVEGFNKLVLQLHFHPVRSLALNTLSLNRTKKEKLRFIVLFLIL